MRRKIPLTINLHPRIHALGSAYAEAKEKSISAIVEQLLIDDMKAHGVNVDVPPDELLKAIERYLSGKQLETKEEPKKARG